MVIILRLDAVQKHHPITKTAAKHLHGKGLVEGRFPNFTISLSVAKMTKQICVYAMEKGLEAKEMEKMILQLAKDAGVDGFKLSDVFDALHRSLPSASTDESKRRFLGRMLAKMAKRDLISIDGRKWYITPKGLSLF